MASHSSQHLKPSVPSTPSGLDRAVAISTKLSAVAADVLQMQFGGEPLRGLTTDEFNLFYNLVQDRIEFRSDLCVRLDWTEHDGGDYGSYRSLVFTFPDEEGQWPVP